MHNGCIRSLLKVFSQNILQLAGEQANIEGITENLRVRAESKLIYTSIGPVLVALNPFEWYNIYRTVDKQLYAKKTLSSTSSKTATPPHIYASSAEAFYNMLNHHKGQCVVSLPNCSALLQT